MYVRTFTRTYAYAHLLASLWPLCGLPVASRMLPMASQVLPMASRGLHMASQERPALSSGAEREGSMIIDPLRALSKPKNSY